MATVSTGTAGVAGNVSADLQTYFAKSLLKQASYKTVLDQFAYKEKIPASSSTTIKFNQYSDLAVATTPLSEGTPPSETQLTVTPITATIDQLGAFVKLTDIAELTVKHPVTQKANELLGVQAARTYDRLINSTVVAGTNVIYSGGQTVRTGIVNASKITFADVQKAVALLRNNGADTFEDGNFVMVIDPSVEVDLLTDTQFANTVYRQTGKNELYKGAITSFSGVTIVRSNNIPTIASTNTVHTSYVFGKDAFAVTDLQTLSFYKDGPGTTADPLHQIMTMGWKVGFKSVVLNQNWMVRIESGSTN